MHIKTEDGHTHEVNSIDHIRFKELPGGTWQLRIYPRFGQHREGWTLKEIDNVSSDEIRRMYSVAPHLFLCGLDERDLVLRGV